MKAKKSFVDDKVATKSRAGSVQDSNPRDSFVSGYWENNHEKMPTLKSTLNKDLARGHRKFVSISDI